MSALPRAAREILEEGTLCYLAAPSRLGPHVTPVVFVLHRDRLWLTTSRRAVKSRAWRRDPRAGGLVTHGERAVALSGHVTLYDALDPFTWPAIGFRAASVAIAWSRFSLKNARFFAGYARDAYRVPFAWSPPGRVLASVDLDRGAVIDVGAGGLVERWGTWEGSARSRPTFRARRGGARPERLVPEDVRGIVGRAGAGVLGLEGDDGPTVVPARWSRSEGIYHAAVAEPLLELAAPEPETRGALVVDRASAWRAAAMKGLLLRGEAEVFVPREVRSGRAALLERISKVPGATPGSSLVRLRPQVAVWWKGWTSGTAGTVGRA